MHFIFLCFQYYADTLIVTLLYKLIVTLLDTLIVSLLDTLLVTLLDTLLVWNPRMLSSLSAWDLTAQTGQEDLQTSHLLAKNVRGSEIEE